MLAKCCGFKTRNARLSRTMMPDVYRHLAPILGQKGFPL